MTDSIDFSKTAHLKVNLTSARTRGHKYEDFWSIVKVNPTAEFNDPQKEVMLQMISKADGRAALESALKQQARQTGLPVYKAA